MNNVVAAMGDVTCYIRSKSEDGWKVGDWRFKQDFYITRIGLGSRGKYIKHRSSNCYSDSRPGPGLSGCRAGQLLKYAQRFLVATQGNKLGWSYTVVKV